MDVDEQGARRRARRVTYTAVLVLLVAAAAHLELWPLTSYRLFSEVRTADRSGLELVAVDADGGRTVVRPGADNPVVATTGHQYGALPRVSAERRTAMVRAWLRAAGVDPADVAHVRLERVGRVTDARSLDGDETSRTLVLEVEP